ncbi:cation:proton antiporter [Halovivax gelatinilyticus]|uniref:cation:proton antiporter n=1 Tax=Halovivax gelatinilyticus TaxID=2961597 RepID=UPI0020CA5A49|nr:cation:proton antiporter [Halovivax gelatinilyticus]
MMMTVATSSPTLPLEEPVLVFAIAMGAFLLGPLLIKRLGQPGIVGIVLFGVALGPNALGVIEHTDAIELLGTVGLIYLLFTVGLELDLQRFLESPEDAAVFGLTSYLLPFAIGTILGVVVLDFDILAALLLAAVFSSHTLLAYPIVNRLNVTKNRAVTAVFGGILFTDTLALVVLAIVIGSAVDGFSAIILLEVFVALGVLFAAIWLLVPPLTRRFFQNMSEESYFEFLFVMVAIFAAASLADVLQLEAILGAFVAGLALNRLIPSGGTLINRVEFVGNAFFIPFFLLHVGMLVDPAVIFDGVTTLQIAAVVLGVMLVTKYFAAALVSRYQGYSTHERNTIFGLSTGQAAAALAITLVGVEQGIFDPLSTEVLNAVVLLMLVTAVISPLVTERAATRLALDRDVAAEGDDPLDPNILLPLSHHAERQQWLLELAFVLKGDRGTEPVHVLTVVRPTRGEAPEDRIATVNEDLDEIAAFGAAAEVPIETETRINHNVASGIVQGAMEVRANQIIMGWDAQQTVQRRLFGSVIDQVLQRTTLPVFISRLGHPINTTREIHLVLPRGVDHHEGFYESVHAVKRIGSSLGVPITAYVVGGSAHQYEKLFGLVAEEITIEFESVADWNDLEPTLAERTTEDDLVVALSPRPGDIGWHGQLDGLPNVFASLPPESFISIYPRQGKPEYDRQYLRLE